MNLSALLLRSLRLWFVVFLVGLLSLRAHAQASASLAGLVQDSSAAVVPGASITVTSLETGLRRSAVTDQSGHFELPSLPVGSYQLQVVCTGFAPVTRTGIHLVVGQEAQLSFTLHPGATSQQITVNADASPVSLSTSDISGLVSGAQIRNLPLNGRSYDELLTLNPGIVNFTDQKVGGVGITNSTVGNNFAVSGNRPEQNLFLLNGVEFTGAAENNMQPGGVSQQLLGVESIQEFNVLRDSYSAEYGKRPGAQVLLVTRGGTNHFHGSLYEFLRNSALD